jgi:NTP pyrophosphatase (non-canonical NTP hydrolase)
MRFHDFSAANRRRCESPNGFHHPLYAWSLSDWFTAVAGELGEAANVAKKLNRVRDGITSNDKTPDQLRADLADEIADTFIYLDLLAQSQGIDLAGAVISKFNRTSRKIGYGNILGLIADGPLAGELMPSPDTVVDYGNGRREIALFHYTLPEDVDCRQMARENGLAWRIFCLGEDQSEAAQALRDEYEDGGDGMVIANRWNPPVPQGWTLALKLDTEDGVEALFVRPRSGEEK